jgi:hypothetical protein
MEGDDNDDDGYNPITMLSLLKLRLPNYSSKLVIVLINRKCI